MVCVTYVLIEQLMPERPPKKLKWRHTDFPQWKHTDRQTSPSGSLQLKINHINWF